MQSFSEKLLGGKIHLLDQCHETLKSDISSQKLNNPGFGSGSRRNYETSTSPPQKNIYQSNSKYQNSYSKPSSYQKPYFDKPSYEKPSTYEQNYYEKDKYSSSKPSKSKKKCPRKLDAGIIGGKASIHK